VYCLLVESAVRNKAFRRAGREHLYIRCTSQ
jgi:hypothetical protein